MTSNLHKRLDKIERDVTELGAKSGSFHFIVGDANESAEAKLGWLKAEGKVETGDEYQIIQVPWVINELSGSAYIPEGSAHDPLAEPELPAPLAITTPWGEQSDREKRWADHLRKIEAAGERYDGDRPKHTTWR